MDAHDIFKKLSKGAIYKRKNTPQATPPIKNKPTNALVTPKREQSVKNATVEPEDSITLLGDIKSSSQKRKRTSLLQTTRGQQLQAVEAVNRFRNEQNIKIVGRHVPDPCKTFEDFHIGEDLKNSIVQLNYKSPTAIQMQAIPIMLANRQLLACAPTGSGKTAAFLLPLLEILSKPSKQGYRALIICPTRELAQQTLQTCALLAETRKLKACTISKTKQIKIGDILVTTPKRLCDLLNVDTTTINLTNIQWLIIDEADKLFEEGARGFKTQLQAILDECPRKDRRIAMFSATHTPQVAKWSAKHLRGLIRVTIGQRNTAAELIDQQLQFVGSEAGKLIAFRDLVLKGLTPPVLVFVQSKERAQQLFSELIYDGINVDAIHADRTQVQRANSVKSFREGKIWVLICTELMARGIDFKGVNLVINYDFPPTAISYVHRIGRAGRAGMMGKAITFFTIEDTVNLRSIAHVLKESGCKVPDYMLYMKKHSKNERKQLANKAPTRDDILTMPFDERLKIDKALGKKRLITQFKRLREKKLSGKNIEKKKLGKKNRKRNRNNAKNE